MEHPLISGLDELTTDELSLKVSELYKKLSIASRSGNGHMCDQIRMAIESYQNKYRQRIEEENKKDNLDDKFGDKINIS